MKNEMNRVISKKSMYPQTKNGIACYSRIVGEKDERHMHSVL